ncbi:transmembrane protein 71 isoform X1 [Microcaecilia unicolor]|uniref:Transmembrane protein 71 isoform X1 n=1 Tax=Microcaecilia unicolor TaxID=1415580 RepID=A0A6P7Z734_9AMPH|nr:transmembrane protein 71 isoform X1 [Microcaecilia unicolor]
MYQLLQLTSTPLGRKYSSLLHRETECNTSSSERSFSSDSCGLPGDTTLEHSCTGSPLAYRRSPRLLSNGYYVLNEDSFLFDDQGNMTLNPCHSVSYKENLVRIFRKKKKIRRTLANLLSLKPSHPWLQSEVFESAPLPMTQTEDTYVEADYDNDELSHGQKKMTSKTETPGSKEYPDPMQTRRKLYCSSPESHIMVQKYSYRQNQNDSISEIQPPLSAKWLMKRVRCSSPASYIRAQNCFSREREINMLTKLSNQMIMLLVCLFLSVCARCILGGLFISWLAFILVIALTCAIKPSLSSFFKSFKLRSIQVC